MKKTFFASIFIFSSLAFGQDVKLKDGFVLLDKKKCFKYESKGLAEKNTFYSLDGQKVFYIDMHGNKYHKIQFVGSNDFVTLNQRSMNARKEFIINLIEEGVIDPKDCSIKIDNFKNFKDRYHKDYETNTTVIINR
jgi:hypothetical protein